ncbi:MAG TPA: DUF4292 domain-containing protein, partial [Chitinophagaceae bacterium]
MMRVFIVMAAAALMVSCKPTRKIQTAIAKKDTAAVAVDNSAHLDSMAFIDRTLAAIDSNRINYNTFTSKINVDYRDADDKNYNLNANLRMYKDSAIWVSVNAILGIEALRLYITRDSVKILDKQNKQYTARSVDYLQEVTALPLNLAILQDLFVGNPVFLDSGNVVSYSRADNNIALLSLGRWFKNLLTVDEAAKTLQRSKLDDADLTKSRTADLTYSDYENKVGVPFATK